jgi:hypothetical protein
LLYHGEELSFIHSFIHQCFYSPWLGPGLFFSFVIFFTHTVGLLGLVVSPSQGRYLYRGQHKHRTNAYTNIHAFSGIRTHDPSVPASEDNSCLRPRGHCDRWNYYHPPKIKLYVQNCLCNMYKVSSLEYS